MPVNKVQRQPVRVWVCVSPSLLLPSKAAEQPRLVTGAPAQPLRRSALPYSKNSRYLDYNFAALYREKKKKKVTDLDLALFIGGSKASFSISSRGKEASENWLRY